MAAINKASDRSGRGADTRHSWTLILHFLWVFFAMLGVLSIDHWPDQINLEAGQVSPTSVMADRTVEIINEKATEDARRRASAQVEQVEIYDPTAVRLAEQKLEETFEALSQVAVLRKMEDSDKEMARVLQSLPVGLSPDTIETLSSSGPDVLMTVRLTATHGLSQVMDTGITPETLDTIKSSVPDLVQDQLETIPEEYRSAVSEVIAESIYPNRQVDAEATKRAEQEAMASVKPITTIIPKGFAVLRAGDIVTPRHIKALEALGVYKPKLNLKRICGYALMVLFLMGLTVIYLKRERPRIYASRRHLVTLGVVVVMTAIICRMLVGLSVYLVPVAFASILITIMFERPLAVLVTGFLSIYVGVLSGSLPAMAVSFMTGAAGVLALSRVPRRSRLIFASFMVGLANLVGVAIFTLADSASIADSLTAVGFGLANGFLSSLLAVGALPMFEYLSGITTHLRLLDLSNQSEPLLQRLTREAPGTYQHSMMVANLAEQAAREIGADALLCRVGAYYHDIGKMKRPRFFIENQMGLENPHDRLAPSLSTKIILSHVKDGLEMGKQAGLPDVILDFIAEHHGTSLVSYFYHQAQARSTDPVTEQDFRYPGPRPQTKETAILMLCDGLEAAARTLSNPTPDKVAELVQKMIKQNLDDGQLDECDLSLKDIQAIKDSLIHSLSGIYHSRIEYPETGALSARGKVTQLRRKV